LVYRLRGAFIRAATRKRRHFVTPRHQHPRYILSHAARRNLRAAKKSVNYKNFHN
jgi:hypothetical protein